MKQIILRVPCNFHLGKRLLMRRIINWNEEISVQWESYQTNVLHSEHYSDKHKIEFNRFKIFIQNYSKQSVHIFLFKCFTKRVLSYGSIRIAPESFLSFFFKLLICYNKSMIFFNKYIISGKPRVQYKLTHNALTHTRQLILSNFPNWKSNKIMFLFFVLLIGSAPFAKNSRLFI